MSRSTRRAPLRWTRILLPAVAAALLVIGILFVHSTTAEPGEAFPGRIARWQLIKALVASALFVALSRLDYRHLARFAYVAYGGLALVLIALLVRPSSSPTARWIELGFIQVQPSELMKVAVILCLARYLRYRESYRRVQGLALPYLLTFAPMALVAMQPDLGTSLMLPPVLVALLYVARARLWPLAVTVGTGVASLPVAFYLGDVVPLMRGYQLRRITDFFEREGYQLQQSLITIGSGGMTGREWGHGVHLPARHTDFIFSVIGEEWGFVGAAGVAALYATMVVLCLRVALATREPFGRLTAAGIATVFAAQSLQNMAMTMGLTPITGLPLPFISHGGSSLASSAVALGIVCAVAARPVRVVASRDLDPQDRPRVLHVVEHRPAGALLSRWPV